MHHSFIYRDHRINVAMKAHKEGWLWRYDFSDGQLQPHTRSAISGSTFEGLRAACSQARQDVDALLEPARASHSSPA